jgi:hypothetical protein
MSEVSFKEMFLFGCDCWRAIAAQLYATRDENTALLHAVEENHTDCLRLLLESGANIEAKDHVRKFACKFLCAVDHEQLCAHAHHCMRACILIHHAVTWNVFAQYSMGTLR